MRFRLLVSEAWRSLGANISNTVASTMTVLVAMFILGLFIAVRTWTVSWSDHVKSELVVKIDFATSAEKGGQATRTEETAVVRLLQSNPKVKTWKFIPRSQALVQMRKTYPSLTKELPYNPLPDSINVTPTRAEYIQDIANTLSPAPPGVHDVITGKRYSSRILTWAHTLEAVFSIGTIILLISSTLLIANTIRLSIFSRRREIEVMKLVGATNWFVRGPFMVEGLLTGLAGSLLAVFFLVLGKVFALSSIQSGILASSPDVHAIPFQLNALILLGIGLGLGMLGSGLTLRRFLRV